ncbi:MAG: sodium/solute symporter [Planctomycetia bacterium]|nr:sodium/solute symporter [Planctomycetia bacterium]
MKMIYFGFCLLGLFLGSTDGLNAAEWSVEAQRLPEKVARPFFGVWKGGAYAEETLYLLGGSFFDRSPNDGGQKQYSRQIVALHYDSAGSLVVETLGEMPWERAEGLGVVLPPGIAEKAIFRQGGMVCLGGADAEKVCADVFFFTISADRKKTLEKLPDLPQPGKMLAGGLIHKTLYVLLGNRLWGMDFSQKTLEWKEKATLPAPPREQAVSVVQNGNQKKLGLFVLGGYRTDSPLREALVDAWFYDPVENRWSELSSVRESTTKTEVSLIGAVGVPAGCQSLLMVGGYSLTRWNEEMRFLATATPEERAVFQRQRFAAEARTFGWNERILGFHTVPNAFAFLPEPVPLATCGSAVGFLGKKLVVAGGEDKPASRVDWIQVGDFATQRTFGWENWLVLLLYFGSMFPMGYYFMRRSRGNAEDYFRGGGRIPWWVNGFSIYATMLSSITFIAIPTMVYLGDWRYYPNAAMIFVATVVVIFFYVPRFRKLNLTCAYEYLEQRFNLFTRLFASGAFILFMIARSAVVMYIPSLALYAVAGMDLYLSIFLVGGFTLIYSTMGGMEAVAWSDFLQAVILVGGAIFVAIFLILNSGGFLPMATLAWESGKFRLWDFSWDPSQPVLWVAVLGGFAQHLTSYTSDQTVIQRYVTQKNATDTNRSIWLNGILSVVGVAVFYLIGTGLFTFYHTHPETFDPMLYANDALFPTYMVTQLPAGLCGLLVAAIFAATVSTISSNFNSSAAAFVSDFFCRFTSYSPESRVTFHVSLLATAVTGILAIAFTLILATLPDMKSLFDIFLTTIGVLTGGLCGLFFLGFFCPRVGTCGAVMGLFLSYAVNFVLIFDTALGLVIPLKPHPLLYAAISLGTCILVGMFVSLLFPTSPSHRQSRSF